MGRRCQRGPLRAVYALPELWRLDGLGAQEASAEQAPPEGQEGGLGRPFAFRCRKWYSSVARIERLALPMTTQSGWTLRIRRSTRSGQFSYFLENPAGGGFGTGSQSTNARNLARAVLARIPLGVEAGAPCRIEVDDNGREYVLSGTFGSREVA